MTQLGNALGLLLRTIGALRDWRPALACFWPVLIAECLVAALILTGRDDLAMTISSKWFSWIVLTLALVPMMWMLAPRLVSLPAIALGVAVDRREMSMRLAPYRPAVTLALVVGTLGTTVPAAIASEVSILAAALVGIIGWPLTVGLLSHAFLGLYPEHGRGMEEAGP